MTGAERTRSKRAPTMNSEFTNAGRWCAGHRRLATFTRDTHTQPSGEARP